MVTGMRISSAEFFFQLMPKQFSRRQTQHQDEDWWAWDLEKHGEFTVKSAYRKLADMSQAPSRLLRLSREVQVMRHGKIFGN
jgi:hypothetical protein